MKKEENLNRPYNPEITQEDKNMLGDKSGNIRTGKGQDEILQQREKSVDFTGGELDVPGRTLPKDKTEKMLKDEENQLYSQGSADNEHLEQ